MHASVTSEKNLTYIPDCMTMVMPGQIFSINLVTFYNLRHVKDRRIFMSNFLSIKLKNNYIIIFSMQTHAKYSKVKYRLNVSKFSVI